MSRRLFFALSLLFLSGFFVLYLKYYVARLKHHVTEQEQACKKVRTDITLLELEWAYLTSPARLEALTKKFLPLSPPHPKQTEGHL